MCRNYSLRIAGILWFLLSLAQAAPPPPTAVLEDFGADPSSHGWRTFGDARLFRWDSTNQNLEVTWDSSKSNSYYYLPLGQTFDSEADFSVYFDLRLEDIAVGTTPGKPFTFQIAVAMMNFAQATSPGFLRGTGTNSPNLVEFDYFPDSGFGATISPTIISSNGQFATTFNLFELTPGALYRVILRYDGDDGQYSTIMLRNGEPFGPIQRVMLGASFTGFSVDTLAICSYSDEGQDPEFGGSIRARGMIDNIMFLPANQGTLDMAMTGRINTNGLWQVEFDAKAGWTYGLARNEPTMPLLIINTVRADANGRLTLVDTNPPVANLRTYQLQLIWAP